MFRQIEPLRTLIVNDDQTTLHLLEKAAEIAGIRAENIWTSTSGSDAIALIDIITPQCLIVDIEMPEVSGYEVIAAQLKVRKIPIIIATVIELESLMQGLNRLGINIDDIYLLPQPIMPSKTATHIHDYLLR